MSNVGIFVTILYMTQYILFFLQTVQDTYDSVYYFFLQTVQDTVCVCRQKIFKI